MIRIAENYGEAEVLHRQLEAMTRVEFIKFLSELQKDLMENPEEWENQNLSDFFRSDE